MTVTELSAFFELISIGFKSNNMHLVTYLLDTGAKPNLTLKDILRTEWLSKISEEVQPLLLSVSKDRLKAKDNIILHIRVGNLLTTVLFTAVENLPINVLVGTEYIDKHILAILPDKQKVTVQKSTPVAIVKEKRGLILRSLRKNIRRMRT